MSGVGIALQVAAMLAFAYTPVALGAVPGGRTILDYYYLLPDHLFYCEVPVKASKELRRRSIVRCNAANGYMEARAEGHPMYLALFGNRKTGLDIVAVSVDCGQGCMCNRFDLLKLQGGAWREVTTETMPSVEEMHAVIQKRPGGSFRFVIPEFGTTMKVLDYDTDRHLMDLRWDGSRFLIQRPAD